ncbi:MAG: 1-deoxy-D-xylulose-5-phosphate synthase [Clostridia bacterium]|nr:1-deoxy-D-xylulose-5-phosphate synthase [Clostridia bacterium]MCI2000932.1 1-deoxy-D-xylulose-5-phosphate synthase [Clostridia bacterium]MCI2015716.1 1-deoxy-D-xylulose-5-phosphate synthase [Clostridia bacterium]
MLDSIKKANDIKKIKIEKLPQLAAEIRRFLLEHVSKTGGHLASNLGIVELTMALHYCFNPEKDRIVWDVGHQAYVHKLLTGRKDKFNTLRQLDGLSGFPKPNESICDAFAAGHSSTSISAALGMVMARDLKKTNEKIIAVIGDGSISGGLAYEGLNNTGRSNRDIIVILNDNQMSISTNVGAMSKHLRDIRTEPAYLNAKAGVHKILSKVPVLGKPIDKTVEKIKNTIKYMLFSGIMFEEMGFTYVGPLDGHNTSELIRTFRKIKNMHGPILVHVKTVKGKGYRFAEKMPWKYHGVTAFNLKTGKPISKKGKSYSAVFGDKMISMAEKNKNIVAISAAMVSGTGLDGFQLRFPERTFDVAIAEQHAVTFAAGLAIRGLTPVFAVYSTFLQRAYDQIIHDVALQNLHVVFAIDRAGVVGADGETHQGIFDLSYLQHIPNMTIMAPSTGDELERQIEFAVGMTTPVAVRYPRDTAFEYENCEKYSIEYGKARLIRDGNTVAVISCGAMLKEVIEAEKMLNADGYFPMIYDARFIKPLDKEMVKICCQKCKNIVTVEDNVKEGGFGSVIKLTAVDLNRDCKVTNLGFEDKFIEQGTREQLLKRYGLDGESIYRKVKEIFEDK